MLLDACIWVVGRCWLIFYKSSFDSNTAARFNVLFPVKFYSNSEFTRTWNTNAPLWKFKTCKLVYKRWWHTYLFNKFSDMGMSGWRVLRFFSNRKSIFSPFISVVFDLPQKWEAVAQNHVISTSMQLSYKVQGEIKTPPCSSFASTKLVGFL